jgi:peptidoglycan/LPS O-acetylase OafA/YrhL
MELEGLRGLAAVSVVVYHFVVLFYPALRSGNETLAHTSFEDNIYGTPLTLLFAGTFAVAIFFVLSGFVLSIGFFQTRDENIVKKLAVGRYLRLMLPALASTLIAFLLISFGAHTLTKTAGEISGSVELSNKWSTDISVFEATRTGVLDIFVNENAILLNGVLWTMYIEFLGSFLVFGFLILFAKSNYRWIVYGLLSIVTFGTWFLAFVIGMMIADAYAQGLLHKIKKSIFVPVSILVVLFMGSYPKNTSGTIYEYMKLDALDINYRLLYLTIAASLVVLLVLLSKRLRTWLQRPKVSILGRYTFSLYLTHLFVIFTVSCAIIINLHQVIGYNQSVLLAALISLPVFWLVTVAFERYIDAPSIKLAKYVGAVYRGDLEIDWKNRGGFVAKKFKGMLRRRRARLLDVTDEPSDHAP